ncbi:uncharacterized protein LOC114249414 [Bombyx mandarina]|uniref:Uncharacterized protein LOC114249414 n=1 Tax=Bombyx mandarina TaxID=7092 RepID=A0A6J2KAV3_BOMMA|nr:uncharacterized protein LOC114249414 [Bombyx mandarina]
MRRLLINIISFCVVTTTAKRSNDELLKQIQLWNGIMSNDDQFNANYEEAIVPHFDDHRITEKDRNIKYLYPRPTNQRDAETQDPTNPLLDRKIQIVNDNLAPFYRFGCRKFEDLITNPTCRSSYCRFNSKANFRKGHEEDRLLRALCRTPTDDGITNYLRDDIYDKRNLSVRNKMITKNRNEKSKSYRTNKVFKNRPVNNRGKNTAQKPKFGGKHKKSKDQMISDLTAYLVDSMTTVIRSIEQQCLEEIHKAQSIEKFLTGIKNETRLAPHHEANNNVYVPIALYKKLVTKNVKAKPYSPSKHTNRLKKKQIYRRSGDLHKTNYGLPFQLQVQGLGQAVYTNDAE